MAEDETPEPAPTALGGSIEIEPLDALIQIARSSASDGVRYFEKAFACDDAAGRAVLYEMAGKSLKRAGQAASDLGKFTKQGKA